MIDISKLVRYLKHNNKVEAKKAAKRILKMPWLDIRCWTNDPIEKTIGASLVSLFASYRKSEFVPEWVTKQPPLKDPYFLIPAIREQEFLQDWSVKTTPKSMAKYNIYTGYNFLKF